MTTPIDVILRFVKTGQGDEQAVKALKDLEKNSGGAAKGIKDVGDQSTKTEKGVSGLSGAFTKLAAGGALLAAGHQLIQFGKASIAAASDAQEMQSKFDTVFGSLGGKVTSELGAFADASNRSKTELMGFAATLQDTLKPMGIAADEAAGFSVDLVKLGTDLSSFNNMPMDEAMRRLQGTLIGSHENALAFGVVINENTLKAELAAQGWDKLTGAQLEAAKVQARINLLIAGTTDAQGDAIKTSDSYANQVKGLEAAMSELQVAVGSGLLPVMTELVGLATQTADRLSVVATGANQVTEALNKDTASGREGWDNFKIVLGEVGKAMSSNDVIWEKLIETAKAGDDAIQTSIARADEMGAFYSKQATAIDETTEAIDGSTESIIEYSAALAAARGPNEDLADKTQMLGNHMTEAESSIARVNLVTAQNKAANEAAVQATEAAAEAAREATEAYREQQAALGGYFDTALKAGEGAATLQEQLYSQAAAAGAGATEMAILAAATGNYTDAEIEAAFQAALMTEQIKILAQQVAAGALSADDAVAALKRLQEGTADSAAEASNLVAQAGAIQTGLDGVSGAAIDAAANLGAIPTDLKVHIGITSDPIPALPNMPGGQKTAAFADGGLISGGTAVTGYGMDNVMIAALVEYLVPR